MSAIDPETVETRLERATEAVATERQQLVDELAAFEAFLSAVHELDVSQPTTPARPTAAPLTRAEGAGTEPLLAAFESTVMAVPHYESEYGESHDKHLREELGPEIATMLTEGTTVGQPQRRALAGTVQTAIERRTLLADVLEREASSLAAVTDGLVETTREVTEIERTGLTTLPADVLDAHAVRLEVIEDNCSRLLEDRQETLVDQRRTLGLALDDPDIPTYLYEEFEVQYPVVATIASLLDWLGTVRADVDRALTPRRGRPPDAPDTAD